MVKFNNKTIYKLLEKQPERTIYAGINSYGEPIFLNLDELPHILIAGTTGSGKSVTLNSIICSLLITCPSYTIQLNMIDTKRVELCQYKKFNDDLICKFVSDSYSAKKLLSDVCNNIDARYRIMEKNGWRKIPDDYYREIVVIEELGDLMYDSKKEVEQYIVKIARLGRACGVHLIVATQRPTVSVVTGEIKANIGCRFALQTTSYTDSINILGHSGAERLKGKGDCLLKLPTQADEIHIQCPYIDDETIDETIDYHSSGDRL